jgi:hypothetical protein
MTIAEISEEIELFRIAAGHKYSAKDQSVRSAVLRGTRRGKAVARDGTVREILWVHVVEDGRRVGGYKLR